MAVKQAELVRAWGLSRGRVSQMVKAGMPLASLEEAEAWRVARYGGSAVHSRQGGQGKSDSISSGGADLPERPQAVKTSDLAREDIEGTLARLKKNELVAWGVLAQAVRNKDENAILLGQRKFGEAAALRVKLEKEVDQILLQKGLTVLMAEAKELFGRHLQAVRMALKNMPSRLAARCNPSDPALAKQTLNEAVERVFKTLNEWDV